MSAGKGMFRILAMHTSAEALAIVRSVDSTDGGSVGKNCSRIATEERWDECFERNASACTRSLRRTSVR